MAAPTLPIHTETLYLTPKDGAETIGIRCTMAGYWRQGRHAHVALAHGTYGCHCPTSCRVGGIHEWRP